MKRRSLETFYNSFVFSKWFEPRIINSSYGVIVLVRVTLSCCWCLAFRKPEHKSCSESSGKRLSVDGVVSLVR